MIELGMTVKDRINGFEGVVTGRAEYLYGCIQVFVAPTKLAEGGKYPEGQWLDEGRVQAFSAPKAEQPESAAERAGGPVTALPPRG